MSSCSKEDISPVSGNIYQEHVFDFDLNTSETSNELLVAQSEPCSCTLTAWANFNNTGVLGTSNDWKVEVKQMNAAGNFYTMAQFGQNNTGATHYVNYSSSDNVQGGPLGEPEIISFTPVGSRVRFAMNIPSVASFPQWSGLVVKGQLACRNANAGATQFTRTLTATSNSSTAHQRDGQISSCSLYDFVGS